MAARPIAENRDEAFGISEILADRRNLDTAVGLSEIRAWICLSGLSANSRHRCFNAYHVLVRTVSLSALVLKQIPPSTHGICRIDSSTLGNRPHQPGLSPTLGISRVNLDRPLRRPLHWFLPAKLPIGTVPPRFPFIKTFFLKKPK